MISIPAPLPDRKLRIVAQLGRETFGLHAGSVHEEANRRALEGEDVTYQWRLQKNRHEFRLLTTVSPMRNSASRITGLLIVTRNLSALAGDALGLGGPATQQARQLMALERGVRQLTAAPPSAEVTTRTASAARPGCAASP